MFFHSPGRFARRSGRAGTKSGRWRFRPQAAGGSTQTGRYRLRGGVADRRDTPGGPREPCRRGRARFAAPSPTTPGPVTAQAWRPTSRLRPWRWPVFPTPVRRRHRAGAVTGPVFGVFSPWLTPPRQDRCERRLAEVAAAVGPDASRRVRRMPTAGRLHDLRRDHRLHRRPPRPPERHVLGKRHPERLTLRIVTARRRTSSPKTPCALRVDHPVVSSDSPFALAEAERGSTRCRMKHQPIRGATSSAEDSPSRISPEISHSAGGCGCEYSSRLGGDGALRSGWAQGDVVPRR